MNASIGIQIDRKRNRRAHIVRALRAIVPIGLIAGTLDITDALVFSVFRGIMPKVIFEFIASGLIGVRSAIELGAFSVGLGIAIHYFIATFWTAAFYAASRKAPLLIRRPVVSGLVYGAFVYVVMNFAVLPLSRIPHAGAAPTIASRVNGVLALLFCIGLPISLLVARWNREGPASEE